MARNASFQRLAKITQEEHNKLLTDVTTLRTKFNTLLTKLDADGGVTDTNYSASCFMTTLTADSVVWA